MLNNKTRMKCREMIVNESTGVVYFGSTYHVMLDFNLI